MLTLTLRRRLTAAGAAAAIAAALTPGAAVAAAPIVPPPTGADLLSVDFDLGNAAHPNGGLTFASTGACAGEWYSEVDGVRQCTHGLDRPLAYNPSKATRLPGSDPRMAPLPPNCIGDGTSGSRVQVVYVHAADVPAVAGRATVLQQVALDADRIYLQSAQETGGQRRIRYVTGADCLPTVIDLPVAATGDDYPGAVQAAVKSAAGLDRPDRKYIAYVEGVNEYCGLASNPSDPQPGPANAANTGPSTAVIGALSCAEWGFTTAHEMIHFFGGVLGAPVSASQPTVPQDPANTAPHSSLYGHCTDENDVVCYKDSSVTTTFTFTCPATHGGRLDCNHDDYYTTLRSLPSSNFLAAHWNTANSVFLQKGVDSNWVKAVVSATATSATVQSAYNSANQPVTVTRASAGRYTLIAKGAGAAKVVTSVSAMSTGATTCALESAAPSGTDEVIKVACSDQTGLARDSGFSLVSIDPAFLAQTGDEWSYVTTTAGGAVAQQATTLPGKAVTVVRHAAGEYTVTVPSLGSGNDRLMQVTAIGDGATRCTVGASSNTGTRFNPYGGVYPVHCVRAASGTAIATDAPFTLVTGLFRSLLSFGGVDFAQMYAWDTVNGKGSSIDAGLFTTGTLTRTATGVYTVSFPTQKNPGGIAQVVPVDDTGKFCNLAGAPTLTTTGTAMTVKCFSTAGLPADPKAFEATLTY